jgi:hypothetical protein
MQHFVISHFAGDAVPNRQQVLPPIPGYIPVYIQHGDTPPDPYEFWMFHIASNSVRPAESPALSYSTANTVVTDRPEPLPGISDSPIYSETSAPSVGKHDKLSNGIPEASDICVSCGNTISEN